MFDWRAELLAELEYVAFDTQDYRFLSDHSVLKQAYD